MHDASEDDTELTELDISSDQQSQALSQVPSDIDASEDDTELTELDISSDQQISQALSQVQCTIFIRY